MSANQTPSTRSGQHEAFSHHRALASGLPALQPTAFHDTFAPAIAIVLGPVAGQLTAAVTYLTNWPSSMQLWCKRPAHHRNHSYARRKGCSRVFHVPASPQ
jgi:hypothetical protein